MKKISLAVSSLNTIIVKQSTMFLEFMVKADQLIFQKILCPYTKIFCLYPKRKKYCLFKLCSNNIIPPEYQAWYKSLAVDKNKKTTIPEPGSSESDTAEDD